MSPPRGSTPSSFPIVTPSPSLPHFPFPDFLTPPLSVPLPPSPSPSLQPTRKSGERRKLTQLGPGQSPAVDWADHC